MIMIADQQATAENKSGEDLEYVGWIPTVLGKLSFTKIDYSCRNSEGVAIVAVGSLLTSDRSFAALLRYFSRKKPKALRYVIMAQKIGGWSGIGEVEGYIFVFPEIYKFPFCFHQSVEKFWRKALRAKSDLKNYCKNKKVREHIDKVLESIEDMKSFCERSVGCIYAKFMLKRNGEFHLILPDAVIDKYVAENMEDDKGLTIAKQLYNCVRNTLHAHKHHRESVDNIVTISLYDESDSSSWKAQVQYSLVRRIIGKHAEKNELAQTEALGISAYLESFNYSVYDYDKRKDEGDLLSDGSLRIPFLPAFNKSAKASMARFDIRRNRWEALLIFLLTYLGAYFAAAQVIPALKGKMVSVISFLAVLAFSIVFYKRHELRYIRKFLEYKVFLYILIYITVSVLVASFCWLVFL